MAPSGPTIRCPNCGTLNRVRPVEQGVPRCGKCHSSLPWLVDTSSADFDAERRASVPVLVDLWAPWCGPCKWIAPVMEQLARTHAGRLKVVRLNVDEAPSISAGFGVQGIPTLIVLRDGEEVDRLVGAPPPPQLEAWVERHLNVPAPSAKG